MLVHAISAEYMKLRRSKILLPCIGLPILGVLIGAGNFYANRAALSMPDWQALWTQVALFYGYFFYPILLAICSAYLWRMEHTNHNWNSLMTAPIPVRVIFMAKLMVLVVIGFTVQIFLLLLYWGVGTFLFHFTSAFPVGMAVQWLICGWIAAISVASMQLFLSMWIRSFAIPIGISLGCCIFGLALYVMRIGKLFPNSLLILGVGATDATSVPVGDAISIMTVSLLYTVLFILLSIRYLKKKDVVAL